MTIRTFFTASEQKQILALRSKGLSIRNISKAIHRCRVNIAAFVNDPVSYQKMMDEAKEASSPAKKIKTPKKTEPNKKKPSATPSKTKTPKKFSKSPGTSTVSKPHVTNKELAEYNKVKMEHRSVIKFLTKLGERPYTIYAQLKKVYKPGHPELAPVKYWASQFRKGRQTILNEPGSGQRLLKIQKCKVLVSKAKATSIKSARKAKTPANKSKIVKKKKKTPVANGKIAGVVEEEVSVKEEVTVKKPLAKKPLEISTGPFTIKLPGMDRISKALT